MTGSDEVGKAMSRWNRLAPCAASVFYLLIALEVSVSAFFAELSGDEVRVVMETPRRHSWGTIPVPAF